MFTYANSFSFKIHTNSIIEIIGKLIFLMKLMNIYYRISHKHTWLANARISYKQYFEKKMTKELENIITNQSLSSLIFQKFIYYC